MSRTIAYCFRSGHIGFTSTGVLPAGALPIAASDDGKKLETAIHAACRWSYPTKRGADDERPLVPGIPEAASDRAAFTARINQNLKRKGTNGTPPKEKASSSS